MKEFIAEGRTCTVAFCCSCLKVSRSAYYSWLKQPQSQRERRNEELCSKIQEIYDADTTKGYRRICDDLTAAGEEINAKRVLRLCRHLQCFSVIKSRHNCCTKPAVDPAYIAENILHREFHAEKPNQKWVTDVTEFKWYEGPVIHKIYLSAILDLCDRRIVSYVISDHNDNPLVFDTLDKAMEANPGASPLFHSDRGFQYTNRVFHQKLEDLGMKQSMSRVGRCIDNGPMEGFWGILKRERYYTRKFSSREDLVSMIEEYIDYYNNQRLQHNLGIMTPMKKHESLLAA